MRVLWYDILHCAHWPASYLPSADTASTFFGDLSCSQQFWLWPALRVRISEIISDSCGEAEEVDLAVWFDVLFYADEVVVQDSHHCFLNPTVEYFGPHIHSSRWPVHRPNSEIFQDRQIALLAGYDPHKGHLFRRIDNLDPARKGREAEYDAEVDGWAKTKLKEVGHRFLQNLELSYAYGARWGHQFQDPVAIAEWEERFPDEPSKQPNVSLNKSGGQE